MDPISHAVIGRAAAASIAWTSGIRGSRGGQGRRDAQGMRGVAAASILGALSPDIDCVLMPVGWDVYLRAHVVGTHSMPGAILTGFGAAVLVRLVLRRSSLRHLIVPAVIAALSHLAADIVTGARLRPAWPLADTIVSLPLVAMGDPFTIAILAIGGTVMWHTRSSPPAARGALAVLCLFLLVKGVMLTAVLRGGPDRSAEAREFRIIEARWPSLRDWLIFERSGDQLRTWRVTAGGGEPALLLTVPAAQETDAPRSRRLTTVRNFLAVHELGLVTERVDTPGERLVLWSDIRFCRPMVQRTATAGAAPLQCALWFGGAFDRNGRAIRQEVRVGDWIQRRAVSSPSWRSRP
jgi:membrane-bound metal-dependent hydrolase YbcI (DUF457 family)